MNYFLIFLLIVGAALIFAEWQYYQCLAEFEPVQSSFDVVAGRATRRQKSFEENVKDLQVIESRLREVARTKRRQIACFDLRNEWQFAAMVARTPFELEWLIVDVWGSRGERLRSYRLSQSKEIRLIVKAERQIARQVKQLEYA